MASKTFLESQSGLGGNRSGILFESSRNCIYKSRQGLPRILVPDDTDIPFFPLNSPLHVIMYATYSHISNPPPSFPFEAVIQHLQNPLLPHTRRLFAQRSRHAHQPQLPRIADQTVSAHGALAAARALLKTLAYRWLMTGWCAVIGLLSGLGRVGCEGVVPGCCIAVPGKGLFRVRVRSKFCSGSDRMGKGWKGDGWEENGKGRLGRVLYYVQ